MAAGTTIQHKRKAGAFAGGQLAAGEIGVDTTNGALYFSTDGATVATLTPHAAVTLGASLTDVLSLSSQVLSAVDAGSDKLKMWDDSAGKEVYVTIGAGLAMTDTTLTAPIKVAILSDVKAYNADGGSFSSGAYRTRDLNTESDPDSIVALASNRFTPIAGTYIVEWSCPAFYVDRHHTRLYNYTTTSAVKPGTCEYSPVASSGWTNRSMGFAILTANGTDAFEIQHHCASTYVIGFGVSANVSGTDSVYTIVQLIKIS